MTDFPRLIEHAFPLKQTSLDSVHEKNVRHGHISTLHIWPARRPLAACRAALIATLLPDPSAQPKPDGMSDEAWRKELERRRQVLCEKIGGKVVQTIERKKKPGGQIDERLREETEGGILHWGRETENAETLEWFRQEIRKAYGGRAPKVLDPFAGGGAIPLEAMRLGCEATAVDINPVAWFILKCTLEYPQKLAGQTRPLPDFILHNDAFMAEFFKKARGYGKAETTAALKRLHKSLGRKSKRRGGEDAQGSLPFAPAANAGPEELEADLAWHVRAWGQWVLDRARRELAHYYPTYADFEPIRKGHVAYEHQPMQRVPLRDDGTPDIDGLNAEFTREYLEDKRNPRWVAKPTVAYLWARTVTCKHCRATVPLLKTRWLCKKPNKRVLLTMEVVEADAAARRADAAATADERTAQYLSVPPSQEPRRVVFGIDSNVPVKGASAGQRREHDKRLGAGTMSRAGVACPCCRTINTMQDVRLEGKAGRLGSIMTAVVVDGPDGKAYRLPTEHELAVATPDEEQVQAAFRDVPFGVPDEPTPSAEALGIRVPLYGFDQWRKLFTSRQLTALGTFVAATRAAREEAASEGLSADWAEAVAAYLALVIGRTANYLSTLCLWDSTAQEVKQTFLRFALPITWDYAEANPMSGVDRYFVGGLSNVVRVLTSLLATALARPVPSAINRSAIANQPSECDLIVTDPPYYDAIPYSDLMDFFYIWLRRAMFGVVSNGESFGSPLSPKWDHAVNDGELIDDSSRHMRNAEASKRVYEDGMSRAFVSCAQSLKPSGRLVIVFANKQPDAWETLVSALIRSGFVVDGSWPIATEMRGGVRNFERASLASSVWLVCKKRPATARPGWDNLIVEEMRANIARKMRAFWDAGIRGPDFVWAATGPAMEAYSKHPVVRKANAPGEIMGVGEFLGHVRRMVVDYVVGQVLSTGTRGTGIPAGDASFDAHQAGTETRPADDMAAADRLDEVTAYYLLHRHDFGMDEAPVGACILYATACGLSDSELDRTWDVLVHAGSDAARAAEAEEAADAGAGDGEGAEDEDSGGDGGSAGGSGDSGGGSKVKLKAWSQRRGKAMGYEAPEGKAVPLIDRIHRVMHLWKAGEVQKVDAYLDEHGLRRNELFKRVVQSLIELSPPNAGGGERPLLESISNHIGAKGAVKDRGPMLPYEKV